MNFITSILKLFIRNYIVFKNLNKADIYIIHSYIDYPAVYIKSKISRAKIVYNAHDAHYLQYLIENKSTAEILVGYFFYMLERSLMKNADQVWTVCSHVAELLHKQYEIVPKVIRNCYDVRLSEPAPENIRSKFQLTDHDLLIVVIGNCKKGQAMSEFIQGIADLPENVHAIFIGANYENHLTTIYEAGVQHRMHMIGQVNAEYVVSYAQQCDIAAIIYYPYNENYRGALPNGFFQSVSAGLPLLYPSSLIEIEKLGEEHNFGFSIDTRLPSDYSKAILQLLDNDKLRESFQSKSIQAATELSWENEENILLQEVANLLLSSNSKS